MNEEIKEMARFDTRQCHVEVFSTELVLLGERVYIVKSDRSNGTKNVRFANINQLLSMLQCYRFSVHRECEDTYWGLVSKLENEKRAKELESLLKENKK